MTDPADDPGPAHHHSLRVLAAVAVTSLAALLAALGWVVAQGLYLDDYCHTRAPEPVPSVPEGTGGRPAYMDYPWTVVCEYDAVPTVEVSDPSPLLGALAAVAFVVLVAAVMTVWLRPEEPVARRGEES